MFPKTGKKKKTRKRKLKKNTGYFWTAIAGRAADKDWTRAKQNQHHNLHLNFVPT